MKKILAALVVLVVVVTFVMTATVAADGPWHKVNRDFLRQLEITESIKLHGGSGHLMFNPDGTKIAYMTKSTGAGSNRQIWVMTLDFSSGTPEVIDNYPVTDADFPCRRLEGWSPDGMQILFTSRYPGDSTVDQNKLWVALVDGSGVYPHSE